MNKNIRVQVLFMDIYAKHIMIKDQHSNHILKCREFFFLSVYCCYMYAKIENERLLFICLNQKKLRVKDYNHLRNAISNYGNAIKNGQICILPASYTGIQDI